jgi:hypothetical protein
MPTYDIYKKSSGEKVYDFEAAAVHELAAFPYTEYEYRERIHVYDMSVTVFGGRRKLTKLEWRKLLTDEENKAFDKLRATVETMQLPSEELRDDVRTSMNKYEEATVMDLDDPAQARGFGLMVALGKMAPYRIAEILNG